MDYIDTDDLQQRGCEWNKGRFIIKKEFFIFNTLPTINATEVLYQFCKLKNDCSKWVKLESHDICFRCRKPGIHLRWE